MTPQIQTMKFLKFSVLLAFFVCSALHLGEAGHEIAEGYEWMKKSCLRCFDRNKEAPSRCKGHYGCMIFVEDLKSREACNEFFETRGVNYPRCNTFYRDD